MGEPYTKFAAFLRSRNRIKSEPFRNGFISDALRAGLPPVRNWPQLLDHMHDDAERHGERVQASTMLAAKKLWRQFERQLPDPTA